MGTSIELCIGKVSLSYAKNNMGIDFGNLFQASDWRPRGSASADEASSSGHSAEPLDENELYERFERPLHSLLPRLELLGHTLEEAKAEYEDLVSEAQEMGTIVRTDEEPKEYLTFDEFCQAACALPIHALNDDYVDFDEQDRNLIAQGRLAEFAETFDRIPGSEGSDMYWSESSFFSERVCILSAEAMLQVLAQNKGNAQVNVTWEFGPIVDAGWVERDAFSPGARRGRRILLATEGASDARIISIALNTLRPEVADFFHFVDVDQKHHFWGTGNLVRFAEGLLRIEILNRVLFVLDNDAEGIEALRKLGELGMPSNMRAMQLPELLEFESFDAYGPEGMRKCNINGRAAAIECYLDLRLEQYPPPNVTWRHYKQELNAWHGALDHKESYAKHFFKQAKRGFETSDYDLSKLSILIDSVVREAGVLLRDL
ncbi:MAG: HEPN/Toprim-associated domain-containing protein [Pseudomonadota bacterium]